MKPYTWSTNVWDKGDNINLMLQSIEKLLAGTNKRSPPADASRRALFCDGLTIPPYHHLRHGCHSDTADRQPASTKEALDNAPTVPRRTRRPVRPD